MNTISGRMTSIPKAQFSCTAQSAPRFASRHTHVEESSAHKRAEAIRQFKANEADIRAALEKPVAEGVKTTGLKLMHLTQDIDRGLTDAWAVRRLAGGYTSRDMLTPQLVLNRFNAKQQPAIAAGLQQLKALGLLDIRDSIIPHQEPVIHRTELGHYALEQYTLGARIAHWWREHASKDNNK